MYKKILSIVIFTVLFVGCEVKKEDSEKISKIQDLPFELVIEDDTSFKKDKDIPTKSKYAHIPTGDNLTQEMAYRFLNMATFGATEELANELRQKGVVAWVDEQLNMAYNPKTQSTLRQALLWAKLLEPEYLNGNSVDEIIEKESLQLRSLSNFRFFVNSAVIGGMIDDKAQLRQKVAYALSQIVIASESVDKFFTHAHQALAYYYDFLLEHAFGNYKNLLYNVTFTPAMATFLTYNGNQKAHINSKGTIVLPDENYAREIMQLFSIGLYELNIDGMQKSDGSKFKESYTQQDVNEMAKVFTGLTYPKAPRFGYHLTGSDSIHPMECVDEYHDKSEKHILGSIIPANQSCEEDIKDAIDILINHNNIAPFISKKLIMRLTKSNPKGEYIKRVAQVFNDNGNGVKGDLKAVIKAILLDKDIWDDIKNGYGTKIKEPFVAYIGVLRALDVKPMPTIYHTNASYFQNVYNKFYTRKFDYNEFAQAPLYSPTVFNFYSDSYVPNNNEFRIYNYVAPELEIQTTTYLANFSSRINFVLWSKDLNHIHETNSRASSKEEYYKIRFGERATINTKKIYDRILQPFGKDITKIPIYTDSKAESEYKKLVEYAVDAISWQLLGKKLDKKQKEIYIEAFSKPSYVRIYRNKNSDNTKRRLYTQIIIPITNQIIISDEYMVQ